MRRVLLAIRACFATLFRAGVADQIAQIFEGKPVQRGREDRPPPKPVGPSKPKRSEALTLMATLQREARLVDFLMEPLEGYDDAQIGAAVRDVHRDCHKVIERLFEIKPILSEDEGAQVSVSAGFDAGRYRLTGKVAGDPPFAGRMVHHGWEAGRCEMPAFTGSDAAARVVAPAEVELA